MVLIPVATSTLIQPSGLSGSHRSLKAYESGVHFFLFLGASACYVPVVVFLLLHYWQLLLERITSPGSRKKSSGELYASRQGASSRADPEESERERWERIQKYMETLANDPANAGVRERLGDIYASMGFYESAVYEYRKAADWLGRGYSQGHMLYKAAQLLVEKNRNIPAALLLLRRIIRLYPKSYFASYARRIVNHYEAHAGETISDS
jgi:tetratricopeptide (TPR) repeat protein